MFRRFLAALTLLLGLLSSAFPRDKFQKVEPVHLDRDGEKWAEKTLKKMSLEEKVGQMLMVWARAGFVNTRSQEYQHLHDEMRKYHLGGFGLTVHVDGPLLLKSEPYEAAMLTNQLQKDSKIPLIFAADFERGAAMRLRGTTEFPHPMAFGATSNPQYAAELARITALEARAIGVQWNWFPDADVNSNPANPIINTRSFGEDPQQVSQFVASYIQGARAAGMLTTAKHFPGHGDTDTDSHLELARVAGDLNHLNSIELPPFRKAIEGGVDAIMVAHVTVPALEPNPDQVATTSPSIVTSLLKEQMGFRGLVVTDAIDMNALMRLYTGHGATNPSARAAAAAVMAGNDMVIIPADLGGAYEGILHAVKRGEIPLAQINDSVLKILKLKASVGLHKARLVDTAALADTVAQPENLALGEKIAEDAVTLVRDNGTVLPLKASGEGTRTNGLTYQPAGEIRNRVLAVVFTEDLRLDWGHVFEKQLRSRIPDVRVIYLDPPLAGSIADDVVAAAEQAQVVLLPVFLVPTAGKIVKTSGEAKSTVGLADASGALLQRLLDRASAKTVILAMGNPYLAADFPKVENYLCTFSNASISEIAAVKALFGEIAIHGHMPVTIPGYAQRGSGIQRPAVASAPPAAGGTH